jgi:taurine transport system substrate-binding protein
MITEFISLCIGSYLVNGCASAKIKSANEVRVAYFLEWPSPNLEDMQKENFAKALGVPVKWTNFSNGAIMTDAMLSGDIDIYIHKV